jgi:hypothetical protein
MLRKVIKKSFENYKGLIINLIVRLFLCEKTFSEKEEMECLKRRPILRGPLFELKIKN